MKTHYISNIKNIDLVLSTLGEEKDQILGVNITQFNRESNDL